MEMLCGIAPILRSQPSAQAPLRQFLAYCAAIDAGLFALWAAYLALAVRPHWARPIPLLAIPILHPSLKRGAGGGGGPTDEDWPAAVAFAYGLAIVEAHALAADLARRAQIAQPQNRNLEIIWVADWPAAHAGANGREHDTTGLKIVARTSVARAMAVAKKTLDRPTANRVCSFVGYAPR